MGDIHCDNSQLFFIILLYYSVIDLQVICVIQLRCCAVSCVSAQVYICTRVCAFVCLCANALSSTPSFELLHCSVMGSLSLWCNTALSKMLSQTMGFCVIINGVSAAQGSFKGSYWDVRYGAAVSISIIFLHQHKQVKFLNHILFPVVRPSGQSAFILFLSLPFFSFCLLLQGDIFFPFVFFRAGLGWRTLVLLAFSRAAHPCQNVSSPNCCFPRGDAIRFLLEARPATWLIDEIGEVGRMKNKDKGVRVGVC